MTDGGPVREHYASEGITERVLTALRNANGPDVPITPETLAPIDHFHGKGVIATEELVAELQPKASDNLLDIGCGIGGPARWIAAKYGCRVTGVDLTAEFCAAARELNNLTGLADRVEILHGSALSTGRTRTQATSRKENLHIEDIASTPAGRDNGEQR